jgi:hypothetical protein
MNVCDGQLSVEECTEAIFKMKLNKSPGIDVLTVELYDIFGKYKLCDSLYFK